VDFQDELHDFFPKPWNDEFSRSRKDEGCHAALLGWERAAVVMLILNAVDPNEYDQLVLTIW
jgi:hypothetical protein